jgi:hypothetical protein
MKFTTAALIAVSLAACSEDAKPPTPPPTTPGPTVPPSAATSAPKPYPLKQCVISGEDLGDEPKVIVHEGQEIKFCCPGCEKDFRKEPAKYLKLIAEGKTDAPPPEKK